MSTLSMIRPKVAADEVHPADVDTRFEVLVRSAVPTQRTGGAPTDLESDFATVFDLDYGDRALEQAVAAPTPRVARRVRVVPPAPRPEPRSVRLTRRGRLVLVLTFLAVALALMIPMSGWATATLTGGTPEPVRVVVVKPGDTLYGIAGDLARPGHVREMVLRIQQLNSLPGGQIEEGQKLAVPRG